MDGLGSALLGLAVGAALGAAVTIARRHPAQEVPDVSRLEARL